MTKSNISIDADDLTTAKKKIAYVLVEAGYLKEVQVSDTLKICGYEPMAKNSIQYQTGERTQ